MSSQLVSQGSVRQPAAKCKGLVVVGVGVEVALQGLPDDAMAAVGGGTTILRMLSIVGAALAACSCCILQMALAGIGLSTGLSSVLSPLGPLRWPMAALSVLMVAVSWFVVIRQRRQACGCRPSDLRQRLRTPKILMLLLASVFTFISLSWNAFDPALMRAML